MDRVDIGIGELRVGVQLGDGRVVPLLDLAVEDLGGDFGVQVEILDALNVEDDGDRRDVHRHVVGDGALGAATELTGLVLIGLERTVGTGEVGAASHEGLTARAGALGGVGNLNAGVLGHELGDPLLLSGLHRRGADTGQGAGQLRAALAAFAAGGLFVAGAAGEDEGTSGRNGSQLGELVHLHDVSFLRVEYGSSELEERPRFRDSRASDPCHRRK